MHGIEGAKENFAFDDVLNVEELEKLLPEIIKGCSTVYSLIGKDQSFDEKVNHINK